MTGQYKMVADLLEEARAAMEVSPEGTLEQLRESIRVGVTEDLLRRLREHCQHDWHNRQYTPQEREASVERALVRMETAPPDEVVCSATGITQCRECGLVYSD